MKTAIVIGATGLIGKQITLNLLKDERYSKIKIFARRESGIKSSKLEEHIVDFGQIEKWKSEVAGDELYSAMGTTIKKAGSKDNQYKIDFTYQYETARAAAENGVEKYLLVSSAGANYKSSNFYLRIKGELEEKSVQLPFKKISIFRPSILLGMREEERFAERIGIPLAKGITSLIPLLKKYKPIEGKTVAEAMIKCANDPGHGRIIVYSLDDIFKISE
ncbi:MAG: NAD(P)H-binding protein [Melioribacteraceae bacterium]|jgi:uncharacterized protein YbjT (DUF2867 family)